MCHVWAQQTAVSITYVTYLHVCEYYTVSAGGLGGAKQNVSSSLSISRGILHSFFMVTSPRLSAPVLFYSKFTGT